MKRIIILFAILTLISNVRILANIKYIQTSKISNFNAIKANHDWLLKHQEMLEKWSPLTNDKSLRLDAIFRMKSILNVSNVNQEGEWILYKAIICSYLFNLNELVYADSTNYYFKQLTIIPKFSKDYRVYWFWGKFQILSNQPINGMQIFKLALVNLPKKVPEDFWNDMAELSFQCGMPDHSKYAMDMSIRQYKHTCAFEQKFGTFIRKNSQPAKNDSVYETNRLWFAEQKNANNIYLSKRLGISFQIDTNESVRFYDFKNHQCINTFQPATLLLNGDKSINVTYALMIRSPEKNEKIEDFCRLLLKKYSSIKSSKIRLNNMEWRCFDINEPSMYPQLGGGKLKMLAIERNEPTWPGLKIEKPHQSESINNYYRSSIPGSRMKGRLFYVLLLDACGDAYAIAQNKYLEFVSKNLVIE